MEYSEILEFHGHACPGLAIGYRMSLSAMDALNEIRSSDEEIVAIVENDACGVDALQCLTGCTFGKGNLIFKDYGKQVYTLYSRTTGKGVRVVYHDDRIPEEFRKDRELRAAYILDSANTDFITLSEVTVDEPQRAQKRESILCANCHEHVMESRTRDLADKTLCIPCYDSSQTKSN
jgi:formylmethanofuran dehydrogenase subunit E